ncbi:MAG: SMP-30/gluconolactonase/LRE family protein [Gammaproteobacteria bacterium]
MLIRVSVVILLLTLGACTTPDVLDCRAAHGLTPDCRFQNPEDFAVSSHGTALIISEMGRGSVESRAGRLVAYVPGAAGTAGDIRPLWPRATHSSATLATSEPKSGVGDPACPALGSAAFVPHGINARRLDDGRQMLYVVNHGTRESIEIFEILDDGLEVTLEPRGCVLAPPDATTNDVVALSDGGFRVSDSFRRSENTVVSGLRMRYGSHRPGFAWEWRPGKGYTRLAGSDTAYANGIESSPDGRYLYLNGYFENAVIKVDTTTGRRVGEARVMGPDNVTWSEDGRLLVASHHASTFDLIKCLGIERGNCGFRFQIVEVDPETLSTRVILDQQGSPIGAATVALPFKGRLYLGTFAGDRIAWR